MTAAILVGVLVAGGVFLILQREMLRVTIGFVLLGHAVNVLFVAAGGMDRREAPLLGENGPGEAADPLPQAFVLTAIVITFAITVYLLALMRAGGQDQPSGGEIAGERPPTAPERADPAADPSAVPSADAPPGAADGTAAEHGEAGPSGDSTGTSGEGKR
ncbi:cation:proton antiporter subunit C [Streptomyces sp. 549]|uniref:sodium:proton antiporter n=1 Tax=Streptomyces sp. 549 TaxID=3049076 RepID=UPI0024C3F0BB|nr:cation:proton antiporter subunit C [Streptomyces sp. 549]MDK1476590.1 cation:proton antiporter subunit C [Streptomyces sp. 549]